MSFQIIPISYIYAEPEYWERYETARKASGWAKAVMLTQIVHTFGKVHLEYYRKAAELDAVARGFEDGHQGEHFRLLRDNGNLPPYKNERPVFEVSILSKMPQPDLSLERMSFTRFKCSVRNAVVLRLAIEIEQSNVQIVMTKMLRWYYSNYWTKAYLDQLESAEQETLSPNMEGVEEKYGSKA